MPYNFFVTFGESMPISSTTHSDNLITDQVVEWFNSRWKPKMGAIDGYDIRFIAALLAEAKPKTIVEIGCASGLSTAVMAMMLEQTGPATLHSIDHADRYYVDDSKEVGYLLEEVGTFENVEVKIHTGQYSLDVGNILAGNLADFCFIDAAHKHPWPLIDTLAVLPLMKAGAYIAQHDLQMFRNPNTSTTGPKILLDQLPPKNRVSFGSRVNVQEHSPLKTRKIVNNIYAIRTQVNYRALGQKISDGFHIGWDVGVNKRISEDFSEIFSSHLKQNYSPNVVKAFESGLKKFNPPPSQ
jgi:predicted O-methyltransferase YrrM